MTRGRSNRQTGDLVEKLGESLLLGDGWLVHRTRRAKFDTNDLFGVFDLMAIARRTGMVRLIQTTVKSNENHRKRKVEEWAAQADIARWGGDPALEVWAYGDWPDGTGFRRWTYVGGGNWIRYGRTWMGFVAPP